MKINVPDKKLNKVLSDCRKIKKEYGSISNKVMIRINTLQAAENLSKISVYKPERCHLLEGNYAGCYAICIDERYRIIIKPKGCEMPYDKIKINEIDIIDIIDYHN